MKIRLIRYKQATKISLCSHLHDIYIYVNIQVISIYPHTYKQNFISYPYTYLYACKEFTFKALPNLHLNSGDALDRIIRLLQHVALLPEPGVDGLSGYVGGLKGYVARLPEP